MSAPFVKIIKWGTPSDVLFRKYLCSSSCYTAYPALLQQLVSSCYNQLLQWCWNKGILDIKYLMEHSFDNLHYLGCLFYFCPFFIQKKVGLCLNMFAITNLVSVWSIISPQRNLWHQSNFIQYNVFPIKFSFSSFKRGRRVEVIYVSCGIASKRSHAKH